MVSEEQKSHLVTTAVDAASQAYAPYSRFRVGAAVYAADGQVFSGANVENASYGLAICAERNALGTAISSGSREFLAIAVACIDANPSADISNLLPCGACRQWISELAKNAEILIHGSDRTFRIEDLLPLAFDLECSAGPNESQEP